MEVTTNLLVALMFITILTMAIGELLSTLADLTDTASTARYARLHVSWVALLLLSYMNLFWHTQDILEAEEWRFVGFLYVISGAVFAFLCARILTRTPGDDEPQAGDPVERFIGGTRRFFVLFALLQGWVIGVDFMLGRGWSGATSINALMIVSALVMASVRSYGVQIAGAVVVWCAVLGALALRGLGVIV